MPRIETPWIEPEPEDLTATMGGVDKHFEGTLVTQPQWTGISTPGPTITTDFALDEIYADASDAFAPDGGSAGGGWSLRYDNNYDVRWAPGWSQNFKTFGRLYTTAYAVIDPDANDWRLAATVALREAWEDAHPTHYAVMVEWEWDGASQFGSHSDRRLGVTNFVTTRTSSEYTQFDDGTGGPLNPQPSSEPVDPPLDIPGARVVIPAGQSASSQTYVGSDLSGYSSSGLTNPQHWALNDLLTFGETVGSAASEYGSDLPSAKYVEVPISDASFDANAVAMTHLSQSWRKTRGMVAWLVPDVAALWNIRYDSRWGVEGSLTLMTQFQPPRYRISYEVDEDVAVPYRRIYPRDDGLAGGGRRNWPPSKAAQSGGRTTGGYL
jgi:hypothetical protein